MSDNPSPKRHLIKKISIAFGVIVLSLAALYLGGGIAAAYIVTNALLGARGSTEDYFYDSLSNFIFDMRTDFSSLQERVDYAFVSGGNELVGHFYEVADPKGLVITAHGIHAMSDDYNAAYQAWFVQEGYDVFAIDLTSSGESEGDQIYGLHQSAYDIETAYESLCVAKPSIGSLDLILVGHSWGAYGALASLGLGVPAQSVIAMAPFNTPREAMVEQARHYAGSALVTLFEPTYDIAMNMKYGSDADLSALDGINGSEANILLFQGDDDEVVYKDAGSVYSHADEVKNEHFEAVLLEGVGHEKMWLSVEALAKAERIIQSDEYAQYASLFEAASSQEEKDVVVKTFRDSLSDRAACNSLNVDIFSKIEAFLQ